MNSIITKDQIKSISEKLELKDISLLSELIDCKIQERKEDLLVRIVFTSLKGLNSFLEEHFDISVSISSPNIYSFALTYGTDERNLLEYDSSMVRVEAHALNTYLSSLCNESVKVNMVRADSKLQGIRLELLYIESYNKLTFDEWRAYLLESEYLIVVLNATHLFPESEQHFFDNHIKSLFSGNRCQLLLSDANLVKMEEWKSVNHRIKLHTGDDIQCSPLFQPADKSLRDRYEQSFGKMNTFSEICSELRRESIVIRSQQTEDCNRLLRSSFHSRIEVLRPELEMDDAKIESSIKLLSDSRIKMEQSVERTIDQAKLSIDSVAKYLLQEKIRNFANILKDSLTEDIRNSENIREEIKSVNAYVEAIWNQFFYYQSAWMQNVLQKELENMIRFIKLDFQEVVKEFNDQAIRDKVLAALGHEIAAIAYIRKKRSGMGTEAFADCLTVGGIIIAFFIPVVGLVTFLSSFMIRLTQKARIDDELKEAFVDNISTEFDKITEQVLAQSASQYAEILQNLENGIRAAYSNVITNTQKSLRELQKKQVVLKENIELINNI